MISPDVVMRVPTSPLHFVEEYWKKAGIATVLVYFMWMLWTAYGSDLRKIPGPFSARFTRLYLFSQSLHGDSHRLYSDLHHRYGKIVRIGPKKLSISDPQMINIIYGISSKYAKSDFYDAFTASFEGRIHENLFATRDPVWHKKMRGSIAQAYSLSSLRQLEPLVDQCSVMFMDAMRDLAHQPIDLGEWLQWYAFDVIGNITFAQTFGFLKERQDRRNVIDGLETGVKYNTVIGQVPEWHPWLIGNERLMNFLMKIPAVASANPVTIVKKMMEDALSESKNLDPEVVRGDFLEFLKRVQRKDPERMSDRDMASAIMVNLFAGSDTTAMALRAIFYFLVKNPDKLRTLEDEISAADREGKFSEYVEFQQGSDLKYLQAVIKEAMRLYPGVAYPLERVVPDGGAELCGEYIPGGTTVGMHAWIVNRDTDVFGMDAQEFKPERWIQCEQEQLNRMDHAFLSFGAGARSCLGKNISMLEMTKFVPQVLRHFHIEWASSKGEWTVSGFWFAKQSGVIMRLIPKV